MSNFDLFSLQQLFTRAMSRTVTKKKYLLMFCVLLACGMMTVFCRGLALHAGSWLSLSLTFLPIFLSAGLLLATGVILIRIYHDEAKGRKIEYRKMLLSSIDILVGTSYLTVPIMLAYLLLWMALGFFYLLNEIPGVGGFFSVVLAFAPFLLNFGSLLLCLLSVSLLYFVAPVVALNSLNRMQVLQMLAQRLQVNLFMNIFLATIAASPLLLLLGLLLLSAFMTGAVLGPDQEPYAILQWFFVAVPFVAILAPAVIFFFNFAAEAYVLLQRLQRTQG